MNYDVGVFTRRRIISPAESYFAVPLAAVPSGVTWDPSRKTSAVSLSGGNLVATATSAPVGADQAFGTSAAFHTSGKYYWELTFTNNGGGTNTGVGVVSATSTVGSIFLGGDTLSVCYYKDGNIYYNSTGVATLGVLTTGNMVCIALDLTSNRLWFSNSAGSAWTGTTTGDPTLGAGGGGNGINISTLNVAGGVGPAVDFETGEINSAWTANFGPSFVGAVPSGFGPL